MTLLKIVASAFILFVFFGCNKTPEKVVMNNLGGKWMKNNVQNFHFKISDSQDPKNIIFVVRNNNDYPYSNLRLIVNFQNKKTEKKEIDTLNYILAKPNGEWIGRGFGDTKETMFQYKLNYKFPENGVYDMGVIHAMRTDNLPGIEDIGVKIETAKP